MTSMPKTASYQREHEEMNRQKLIKEQQKAREVKIINNFCFCSKCDTQVRLHGKKIVSEKQKQKIQDRLERGIPLLYDYSSIMSVIPLHKGPVSKAWVCGNCWDQEYKLKYPNME